MWKTEALAFGMTIGGAVLVLFGITALVAGGDAGFWLARHLGIAKAYVVRLALAALAGHRGGHHVVRRRSPTTCSPT